MTQTLRLTALDEMFITDDIDIVPSVQIEARVSGRFDLDRLAAALRAAVAKHALARARLGPRQPNRTDAVLGGTRPRGSPRRGDHR